MDDLDASDDLHPPVPIELNASVDRRLPETVEAAAYYVVAEHSPTSTTTPAPAGCGRLHAGIPYT